MFRGTTLNVLYVLYKWFSGHKLVKKVRSSIRFSLISNGGFLANFRIWQLMQYIYGNFKACMIKNMITFMCYGFLLTDKKRAFLTFNCRRKILGRILWRGGKFYHLLILIFF